MRSSTRIVCKLLTVTTVVLAVSSAVVAVAEMQSPAAQRGLTFVRANCGQCHATDTVSESPLKIAPPFRTLHLKYPVETLRNPLMEGVIANHPTMPAFRLDPGQASDVIAYLKTFEQ